MDKVFLEAKSRIKNSSDRIFSCALSHGGDFADIYYESTERLFITMEDLEIKEVNRQLRTGASVRVIEGERVGFGSTEISTVESIEEIARIAARISQNNQKKEIGKFNLKQIQTPKYYSIKEDNTGIEEKCDLLKMLQESAFAADAGVKKVDSSLTLINKRVLIITSDGQFFEDDRPMISVRNQVIAESAGKREKGASGGGGRIGMSYLTADRAKQLGEKAASEALRLIKSADAPAGEFPVVLAPGDAGVLLHEAVGHGLEADFNRKKTSYYSDHIGDRVASELCTVIDDGTIKENRGSLNIDDEGTATGQTVLIENGILRGYMTDRLNSKLMNLPLTGNGRRQSFSHPPFPRMRITYLDGGYHKPEEIIKSVKKGIYADGFAGGQVDIMSGDFVFVTRGTYLIENGSLTSPLKGATIVGNGPEVLNKISMVGDDLEISDGKWSCGKEGQAVPVGVGTPTIKISAITVGGTGGKQ